MENTFERIKNPDQVYDLKGSLIGRKSDSCIFGKDLDFID